MTPPPPPTAESLLAHARAAWRRGDLDQAMRCVGSALATQPEHPGALHLLARITARQGNAGAALDMAARAAALQPDDPDIRQEMAMLLARQDRLDEAIAGFDVVLALAPEHAGALLNRAVALHRLGRLPDALAGLDRLVRLHPGLAAGWTARAAVLEALRRLPAAVASEARAAALLPGQAAAQTRLARLLARAGDAEAALAHFALAVQLSPQDPDPLIGRALIWQSLWRHEEALRELEAAAALAPDEAAVLDAQAASLAALGRWPEADASRARRLQALDRAVADNPDQPEPRRRRAMLLYHLDRFEEALADHEASAPPASRSAQAWFERGALLSALGRETEALGCYDKALALQPATPRTHYDRSMNRLALGDLPAAWTEFEWRWQVPEFPSRLLHFDEPRWTGAEEIAGKRLLLHAEQGLGDTLQFCRYASLAAARGATVLLQVQPQLVGLLQSLPGPAVVLPQRADLPAFDLHCPLMSLPRAFGTSLETIPAAVPYLSALPERIEAWRSRLGPAAGLRIGLVWSGNSRQGNDRRRSMPLAAAAPIFRPGIEVFALQPEVPERDLASLAGLPGLQLLGPQCQDFRDVAAVISLLDVVVTVDTSFAHLTGALGRPVFVLLSRLADWRWLLHRRDSPWYPTARLFRQPSHGDWGSVMAEVATAIAGLASARETS
jgi:tetratricopeptide (TPR) repeat protein